VARALHHSATAFILNFRRWEYDACLLQLTAVINQAPEIMQVLMSDGCTPEQEQTITKQIGVAVAKMHDGGLVHGDLTTSNMILRDSDTQVVFIDFGLAHFSTVPEDKGVDLYVLERALSSTHAGKPHLFKTILESYRSASSQYSATFNRFAEVRQRGRKRTMVG
jgi:TP53 regulating kinase and related kinases